MGNRQETMFSSFFRKVFIVGYNDGLAGVREFATLIDALAEAEGASALYANVTVRERTSGELISMFD